MGYLKSNQPGLFVPAIDDAGLLEDLGEARDWVLGRIKNSPLLPGGLTPKVVVETRVGWPDVSKFAPPGGMATAAIVDAPNKRGRL